MPNYDSDPPVYYDTGARYDQVASPSNTQHMAKIRRNWNKKGLAQRIEFADKIITNLKKTPPPIATPKPTLVEMDGLLAAANAANDTVESLEDQLKSARALRATAVDNLMTGLDVQGSTCESATSGDAAQLLALGWELIEERAPVGPMGQVKNLSATAGDNEGESDLQWEPEEGAGSYEIETSANPTLLTGWAKRLTVTQSKATLPGLPSGQRCWFRVRAIGPLGPGAWSDEASKMVP